MHGMLHREVWEKFNSEMTPGSVLVLKNVGVISAGATSRRHVLNITTNNLTAIYSNRQGNFSAVVLESKGMGANCFDYLGELFNIKYK